ncbi:hypothetical protein [Synechococcus sp. PCC 7335]|uniref:hypothetical protein n=1 Tax=Synechococcus sp. (strain ATCC 29403 / PCC 7335) TaxID=91464 RepID=UPI00056F3D79|nr:hypothetical protein [Synechococcus sp. PCC 7335]
MAKSAIVTLARYPAPSCFVEDGDSRVLVLSVEGSTLSAIFFPQGDSNYSTACLAVRGVEPQDLPENRLVLGLCVAYRAVASAAAELRVCKQESPTMPVGLGGEHQSL